MKVRRSPKFSLWRSHKGMLVMLIALAIVTSTSVTGFQFFKTTHLEYKIAVNKAQKMQSYYCAKTGFQSAMAGLILIPEKMLYQFGIAFEPPPLQIGNCSIYYRIVPEDGKINVNYLVNDYDGSQNQVVRDMMNNLFESLNLRYEEIDKIVDYIDPDDYRLPDGLEVDDYEKMKPRRRIKNSYLYSSQELYSIPGIDYSMLNESRKPPDWDETHSTDFATDVELAMRSDADWMLNNNISAFPRANQSKTMRVNLNAAGYFVLKSINLEVMDDAAIKRIVQLRLDNNGFIEKETAISNTPEFQRKVGSEQLTAWQLIKDNVTVKGNYYRIIGHGSLGQNSVSKATLQGILDKNKKELVWYKEY